MRKEKNVLILVSEDTRAKLKMKALLASLTVKELLKRYAKVWQTENDRTRGNKFSQDLV